MEANPSGATDIDGGAGRINTLFNPEQLPTEEEQGAEVATAETAEEATNTEEAEETPETLKSDTDADPELYTVKVGGEEQSVTLEDLQKGYMMEADYRRKSMDLGSRRKALEAKETELDKAITDAQSMIELDIDSLESPEMQQLKADNPDAYLKEFERVQKRVTSLKNLQAKRQEERQEAQNERAKQEMEKLDAAIPEWLDPDVKNTEAAKVFASLEATGFSRDELAGITDHRMFVIARKAMLFDQINQQDLEDKKVRKPPKSAKPGATTTEDKGSEKTKNLRQQLKQSGSVKDAQQLFRSFME